jgi:hypothetical protein
MVGGGEADLLAAARIRAGQADVVEVVVGKVEADVAGDAPGPADWVSASALPATQASNRVGGETSVRS